MLLGILTASGCPGAAPGSLTAEVPLHLEEHLETASVEGSEVPVELPTAVEWEFDRPQPDWKAVVPVVPNVEPVDIRRVEDALRVHLGDHNAVVGPGDRRRLRGAVFVDLPRWQREDWAHVLVRARTSDDVGGIGLAFNLRQEPSGEAFRDAFRFGGEYVDVISDGSVQTYLLRADWSYGEWEGPWEELVLIFGASEPADIDILSVSVIPKEAGYADSAVGVRTEVRGGIYRRALYTHAPGRVSYRVRVPESGRLDVGLGVLRGDEPVTFRVLLSKGAGGVSDADEGRELLRARHADEESWSQRTVDLARWAGRTVTIALEADAERDGTVALWAAPTISGAHTGELPNVVLYIIDAAGADYVSVYGYNRPTTPNLERLAAQGAVFERAYSNSTWSKPSTPSFMTGLHHSVLGGYVNESDRVPADVVTLPEHLHGAGYHTAVITSNAYAGTMTGLEQGVDFLRERGVEVNSTSSRELHEDFWGWRDAYPGEPWFVHFQTTDVHWPYKPQPPFAGRFVGAETRNRFYDWEERLADAAGFPGPRWISADRYPPEAFQETGIDRQGFFHVASALYDEAMAHNDAQIGRFVQRLRATGQWENTLLIVAADHANNHALGTFDPIPRWKPLFQTFATRIPLIVVWPGRIDPGQRFRQPVSMIDVLPTILGLAGLPAAEITQGQSLASLLRGEPAPEVGPVILEEAYFEADDHELDWVTIEVIDGRWGASLGFGDDEDEEEEQGENRDEEEDGKEVQEEEGEAPEERPPLLLYDLWSDPYSLNSLHEERPELARRYRELLEARWEAHQKLALRFKSSGSAVLTGEQLRTLRALGYIR